MSQEVTLNEKCIVGLPTCGYAFSNTRMAFIAAPADEEFALEIDILKALLEEKGYEAYVALTRIIHEHFYCNRRYAAPTSLAVVYLRPGGQARPSRPRRTVSSTPHSLGAPRARLTWRLGGFVTNRHE